MRVKHTQDLPHCKFVPEDERGEPIKINVGDVVEVPDALGVALIHRGWGEDVTTYTDEDAKNGKARVVVVREPTKDALLKSFESHWKQLYGERRQVPNASGLRPQDLEAHIADMEKAIAKKAIEPQIKIISRATPVVAEESKEKDLRVLQAMQIELEESIDRAGDRRDGDEVDRLSEKLEDVQRQIKRLGGNG